MTRESQPFYIRFLFELFVSLSLKNGKRGEDISVSLFFYCFLPRIRTTRGRGSPRQVSLLGVSATYKVGKLKRVFELKGGGGGWGGL